MKTTLLAALVLGGALSATPALPQPVVSQPVVALAEPAAAGVARDVAATESTASAAAIRDALAAADAGDPGLAAVEEAYAAARFEPLWIGTDGPTRQMRALAARMRDADADGLDPSDYAAAIPAKTSGIEARATADVGFSLAVARYLTHLGSGRVDPRSISRIITLEPERPEIARLLPELARTAGIAAALKNVEPPHAQYGLLRDKLAALRAEDVADRPVQIPEGAFLKLGRSDPRVSLLRMRLSAPPAPDADPELMDEALVDALKAFQAANDLNADGVLGPRTLLALNGPDPQRVIDAIVANMERWRWAPRDLGALNVTVNIPEFVVRVNRDGETIHQTRVVVGAPDHKTPIFSDEIGYMVVNPYWNVPSSIVTNEMLPEILADPYGYFDRRGYQVLAQVGGTMQVINPAYLDWRRVNPKAIRIRQVPGERNALGRIKFMFPNQHSVYLHDTPSKRLFEKDYRAYSHGCVRVDEPLDFADALLPHAAPEWSSARLEKLYGGKERRIDLDSSVPVHLAYFTVTIGEDGGLSYFEDVYGLDERFLAVTAKPAEG